MSNLSEQLLQAVKRGDAAVVSNLLTLGADINYRAWGGRTPLQAAADGGYTAIVSLLITNHADIEAADNEGRTALMRATIHGRSECTRLLLEAGANIKTKDKYKMRVLDYAVKYNRTAIADRLTELAGYNELADYSQEALASLQRGLEDAAAGRVDVMSFAQYADLDIED